MGFKLKGRRQSRLPEHQSQQVRSIALDLKTDAGRAAFYKLAKTADVIVENYRPGVMKKLGIDYEDDRSSSIPSQIYASISGFGQTGPWADRPGFDLIAQACRRDHEHHRRPRWTPREVGCPGYRHRLLAVHGLYAHSQRLYRPAGKSGEGQYIDASLYEAGLAFAIWDISEYLGNRQDSAADRQTANSDERALPGCAMHRTAISSSAPTTIACGAGLCDVIGRPDLARVAALRDHRGPDGESRSAHRRAGDDVPHAPVRANGWRACWTSAFPPAIINYAEALDNEQARSRDMVMELDHPVEGKFRSIGFPVKLRGTPQQVRRPPPRLGEHTAEITSELGFSDDGAHAPGAMTNGSVELIDLRAGSRRCCSIGPKRYNAMTFATDDRLAQACEEISADETIRAVAPRGSGKAFVAGTDIKEFRDFKTAAGRTSATRKPHRRDESILTQCIAAPTLAVVTGAGDGRRVRHRGRVRSAPDNPPRAIWRSHRSDCRQLPVHGEYSAAGRFVGGEPRETHVVFGSLHGSRRGHRLRLRS